MSEEWREIEEFPGYSVSDHGRVRNNSFEGRVMGQSRNQQGLMKVGLYQDGQQHIRSVALLVAKAFLPEHNNPNFNTPINIDGDRSNNHVDNLMWRPRWFAIKYHQQFRDDRLKGYIVPIEEMTTGERFKNSMDAATKYGILAQEIVIADINRTHVFPTYQMFRVIQN